MQRTTATAVSASLLMLFISWSAAESQQAPKAATQGAAPASQTRSITAEPRLDLSAAQERTIYQSVTNAKTTRLPPGTPMMVGTMVPNTVALHDFPRNVTEQVGALAGYKYVKLEDRKLMLVDPTSRVVAGVITGKEGSLGAERTAPGREPKSR